MKTENKDFFWPSYVDLLTALFIVMLVLFVLSYKLLSESEKTTKEKLRKITEVQNAVSHLPKSIFEYEPTFKRYTLKRQVQFALNSDVIPEEDYDYLKQVGNEIKNMIDSLNTRFAADSIKYVIIIEGMASNIGGTYQLNYLLSYQRAKSIYEFWKRKDVDVEFDPSICEVIISGSGLGGVGRFSGKEEHKNQRILMQIIPKLSKFESIETNL